MLNGSTRQLKWWLIIAHLKPFEWDNPANLHVSLIVSTVGIYYELVQEASVWNGNVTHVSLTLEGCPYR